MANESMYTHIGPCELCGEESNQAGGGHVICTRCEEIWSQELRSLEPDEKASKAWDRARRICKLKAKVDKLISERNELAMRVSQLEQELNQYKEDTKSDSMPISDPNNHWVASSGLCITRSCNSVRHELGKYGALRMSTDGYVYVERCTPDWIAYVQRDDATILIRFNDAHQWTKEEQEFITDFIYSEMK